MFANAGVSFVHVLIALLMWAIAVAIVLYLAYRVIRRGVRDGMLDAQARTIPPTAGGPVPPTD
ncbi:hypothetical protein ACGIF2_00355 [Cellulomonas sp. P22]|uniref:hypothetical protein n=1 Tax=Cellulomonas sp. P22 TaxID=3373189 RepID=UPI0037AA2E48